MLASTHLPPDPSSPGAARAWATRLCEAAGLGDLCDSLGVVVSELVTNAVVHARSDATVALTTLDADDGTVAGVRVAVTDGDSRLPRFEPVDEDALGGRGLRLVQALSLGYGVEVEELQKTVWAELVVPAEPRAPHPPQAIVLDAAGTAPPPRVPVA